CSLAKQRPAAGLILESTFTSVADIAKKWLVPASAIISRFESEPVVRSFPRPILIFHGRHDHTVPYSHAVHLQRAAQRATLVSYDCGHNDLPRTRDGFWAEVERYLRETLQPPLIASH